MWAISDTLAVDNEYHHGNKQICAFNKFIICASAFLLPCLLPKNSNEEALKSNGKANF